MKKIISLLTIFALLFTMMASLNATTVLADTEPLYSFKYFKSSESKLYTGYDKSTEKYSGEFFQIGKDAKGAGVSLMTDEKNDQFLNIVSSKYIWNNAAANGADGEVTFKKPVMNLNFKMYIPKADLASERSLTLMLAKKDASATRQYNNSNYGSVYFTLTNPDGKLYGGANTNTENIIRVGGKLVEGDMWHDMSIRVFINVSGQLWIGMYMDNDLYIWCRSTATSIRSDDIGIRQVIFNTSAKTYIKDIKVDFEDVDPAYLPDRIDLRNTNGTATAWAPVAGGTPRLILAAYNTYGKMVTAKVSTAYDIKDGVVSLNLNTSGSSGVTKVKAFMFDSLTSCVPLAKAATWTQSN